MLFKVQPYFDHPWSWGEEPEDTFEIDAESQEEAEALAELDVKEMFFEKFNYSYEVEEVSED